MSKVTFMTNEAHTRMTNEAHTRINNKGALVVPASIRRALGIKPGDWLLLRIENGELRIATARVRLAKAQRIVRKHIPRGISLVDELIAERREAARYE
jgi:AbrB family looped-hinge helix DNA binding protein